MLGRPLRCHNPPRPRCYLHRNLSRSSGEQSSQMNSGISPLTSTLYGGLKIDVKFSTAVHLGIRRNANVSTALCSPELSVRGAKRHCFAAASAEVRINLCPKIAFAELTAPPLSMLTSTRTSPPTRAARAIGGYIGLTAATTAGCSVSPWVRLETKMTVIMAKTAAKAEILMSNLQFIMRSIHLHNSQRPNAPDKRRAKNAEDKRLRGCASASSGC